MFIKKTERILIAFFTAVIFILLVRWFVAFELKDRYVVPIMMSHRVADTEDFRTDTVSPANFRTHMQYLKENGYYVITLSELVDKLVESNFSNADLPRKAVVITFDDGYENNFTHAFPVLKEFGYRATTFISPDLIGKFKDGDEFLNWDQIKMMQKVGVMNYGSHGMTQAYLPSLTYADQQFEIGRSKKILEKTLSAKMDCLSYPVGGFTQKVKEEVKNAGYRCAVTTNRGADRYNRDVFELNRIRFSDKDNTEMILWAKLNGFYNLFRELKGSH